MKEEILMKYIGNKKFASLEEAITLAKEVDNWKIWEIVLGRDDVQKYLKE